ncbi:unannotated protein [freshwater metagenome]|uniref:Unannotated protein n=1 Tax=freshwater metagenome TaxID=449393 RepID=A0A6J7FDT7_9ZZZZ|nr:NTP transferase domain-containing protein [Actinomycetota bacterium]
MASSLTGDLAGLALAAGAGLRLRPLTLLRPKPLCFVGDRTLLDWALKSLHPLQAGLAVNAHHGAEQIRDHLLAHQGTTGEHVHLSIEPAEALGTAGAVGALRPWLNGRGLLIVNADTFQRSDLSTFVSTWNGDRVRILTATTLPFTSRSSVVASLLPWRIASTLEPRPGGLWELVWRQALAEGSLEAVYEAGPVIDCGTPQRYLQANMLFSGGESIIGEGAEVLGSLTRSVVWPGSTVGPSEHLVDAVRAGPRTMYVR